VAASRQWMLLINWDELILILYQESNHSSPEELGFVWDSVSLLPSISVYLESEEKKNSLSSFSNPENLKSYYSKQN
jgi:hypothetical protein